jgi:CubicO group peptidase (beta-lactamase class C family)
MMMMTTMIAAGLLGQASGGGYSIDRDRLKMANNRLRNHIHRGNLAGAVTLVFLDGKVVSHESFGWSDLESKTLMKRDTIFQVMSMTKPVTAAAVMICVERGLLSLDDPVERYLPQFEGIQVKGEDGELRAPSSRMTIRHLLSHTSGLASDDPGGISDEDKSKLTLGEYAKLLGTEPLRSDPGTVIRYSGVGFSTAAAIIEVVTGRKFDEFVGAEIFVPLGMKETFFFLPERLRPRLAQVYTKDKGALTPFGHDRYRVGAKFANGAGGLYSTAADMGRFMEAFAGGNRKSVLSPRGLDVMTRLQTGNLLSDGNDGRGYGVSWSVVRGSLGQGTLRSVGSFGHTGAFGTEFWHDRETGISLVFLAQTFFISEDARRQYATMVNASLMKE